PHPRMRQPSSAPPAQLPGASFRPLPEGVIAVSEELLLEEITEDMDHRNVRFLYTFRRGRWCGEPDVAVAAERPARLVREAEDPGAALPRRPRRTQHIRRVAARADRYQYVARPHQRFDLAPEGALEVVIVTPAGERRRVHQMVCG